MSKQADLSLSIIGMLDKHEPTHHQPIIEAFAESIIAMDFKLSDANDMLSPLAGRFSDEADSAIDEAITNFEMNLED